MTKKRLYDVALIKGRRVEEFYELPMRRDEAEIICRTFNKLCSSVDMWAVMVPHPLSRATRKAKAKSRSA